MSVLIKIGTQLCNLKKPHVICVIWKTILFLNIAFGEKVSSIHFVTYEVSQVWYENDWLNKIIVYILSLTLYMFIIKPDSRYNCWTCFVPCLNNQWHTTVHPSTTSTLPATDQEKPLEVCLGGEVTWGSSLVCHSVYFQVSHDSWNPVFKNISKSF